MRTVSLAGRVLSILGCVAVWTVAVAVDDLTGPVTKTWEALSAPATGNNRATAIVAGPNEERVFVAGYNQVGVGSQAGIVAYDFETGQPLWTVRYSVTGAEQFNALAVSPDGRTVYAAGLAAPWPHTDFLTIAYDAATGARIWTARYDGPAEASNDIARSVVTSPDGSTLYVTGGSEGDYATVAYSASTGSEIWAARYDGPASGYEWAEQILVSPDGSAVFVMGESESRHGEPDFLTLSYDAATGDSIWEARFSGRTGRDKPRAMALSPDGSFIFVTGWSEFKNAHADISTVGYDAATGHKLWTARYDGPDSDRDQGWDIDVAPDGDTVFVTGVSRVNGRIETATLAYDAASGNQEWLARYEGPISRGATPAALNVSPNGKLVFVTGTAERSQTKEDFDTIAYDAARGVEFWAARHNGYVDRQDFARDAIVSSDGSRVVVTGTTRSFSGSFYGTVAYTSGLMVGIKVLASGLTGDGVLSVALLGSTELDVTEVDPATLRFGPDETEPIHDLTDPINFAQHVEDANLDGLMDLVMHCSIQEIGCDGGIRLSGTLNDSRPFASHTPISVVDCP